MILLRLVNVGHSNKGLALDSRGNAWIASRGRQRRVSRDPRRGRYTVRFAGGGSDSPWGITVDGDDNVWVGNFGPFRARRNDYRNAGITKLAGVNRAPPAAGFEDR